MIENMRYYISGNKIMVKWNWLGENAMVATCRLVKRLNGREIARKDDITMMAYWNEQGGCSFDMPKVPVRIELTDSTQGEWVAADVWESPKYRIEVVKTLVPWEKKRFFRTETGVKMKISVAYPEELEEDELSDIEGWILSGRPNRVLDENRFFLPRPTRKRMDIPPFEITEADKRMDYQFEIVPEVRGTKFDRMFAVNTSRTDAQSRAAQYNCNSLDFGALNRRDEDGHYPIVCPYCFAKLRYDQPVFRALAYQDERVGFRAEIDDAYDLFIKDKSKAGTPGTARGKVLAWDESEISKISYVDHPDRIIPYKNGAETESVVVTVIDRFGNSTVEKICPECHHNIPRTSGHYPNVFISMMGNTGSGKTVYLASMLNMLRAGNLLPGYKFDCRVCKNARSQAIENVYKFMIEGRDGEGNVHLVAQNNAADSTNPMSGAFTTAESNVGGAQVFSGFAAADAPNFADFTAMPFDAAAGVNAAFSDPFSDAPSFAPMNDFGAAEQNPIGDLNFDQLDLTTAVAPDAHDPREDAQPLPPASERSYEDPCIYELTGEGVGFSLSFFDFPGEAIWESVGALTTYDHWLMQMINHADGMIFLFDPSSISRVQNLPDNQKKHFWQLTLAGKGEKSLRTLLSKSPEEILKSFQNKYMQGKVRLSIPVAMVISKSDAIRDWLKQEDAAMQNMDTSFLEESVFALDRNRTGVNLDEMIRNSQAVIDFLGEPSLQSRCNQISSENHLWVCASATGIAPDDKGTLFQRHGVPVHLLDPIEWILYRTAKKNAD